LAQLLVEREVIFAEDVEKIFGKRPWTSRADELLEAQMRAEAEKMAEERTKQLEAQQQETKELEAKDTEEPKEPEASKEA
jgi:cell division protease FtsH